MKSTHAAVLNMLVRVQRFLNLNGDTLGTINESGYRAILDEAVTTLGESDVTQAGSKRAVAAQVAKERVLRNALKVNNMRPIATVAAAQLRQVPEFLALKMPPVRTTSRALVASAGAMAEAAATYSATFVDAGLPTNFLTALNSSRDALNSAINSRSTTKSTLTGATASIAAEASRGRQAVKVLDSLVEPLIAGNVALLTQWQTAKRIGGKAQPIANSSIDAAAKGPVIPTAPTASSTPAVQPTITQPQPTATPSASASASA